MKKNIHPVYHQEIKISCACDAVFVAGSTAKELKVDICSQCHPFYTGKQKLIDSAGRVDKFLAKRKKAESKAVTTGTKKKKEKKLKKSIVEYVNIEENFQKESAGKKEQGEKKTAKKTSAKEKEAA